MHQPAKQAKHKTFMIIVFVKRKLRDCAPTNAKMSRYSIKNL